MVTDEADEQVRKLMKLVQTERTFGVAAVKAGMDEKTARKYKKPEKLLGEVKKEHTWRTRKDPFEDIWDDMKGKLEVNPGLESGTVGKRMGRLLRADVDNGRLSDYTYGDYHTYRYPHK